ncbi:hypothetical protein [Trebonia sp.]|uniref:hypothetical protein n=1 Tax=Trebonia sp. TaxID=2767075 RepID=UPI0026334ED8|nr:hypothetical protein [Trebonia sp.]
MTNQIPKLLLDTCSIINLSYCAPVAAIFRNRYEGSAGWVRAAHDELVRQRGRRPPHPQAGRATNWAATWLGAPIEMTDIDLIIATESIQRDIAAGSANSALDHLGEAASIALLQWAGTGRLISDDHGARGEARKRGVRTSSTVGVMAQLLTIAGSGIDVAMADTYLEILQAQDRMHMQLKSVDLLAGDLGPWQ